MTHMPRGFTTEEELDSRVDAYLNAFNEMDLETVMHYFAPDSVYEPGDGTHYVGEAQIREAFAPQFAHAWGSLFFSETDRIIDMSLRKVVLTWECRIDASAAQYYTWRTWLRITFGKLRYGKAAVWKGLDVLHFDEQGLITKKLTYANYKALLIRPSRN